MWKSENNRKDTIINVYELSERTYEEQIKGLEEDYLKSYRTQSRITIEMEGLKKMYIDEKLRSTQIQVNLIS